MRIAIDFDGTIVDSMLSDEYINKDEYIKFLENCKQSSYVDDIQIVTSRDEIAIHFIHKYSFLDMNKIVCCGNNLNKIEYLNKNDFDVVIDNEDEILKFLTSKFKFNINTTDWKLINFLLFTKKPFSPGPVPQNINFTVDYSHRSEYYFDLFSKVKTRVLKEIGYNNELVFIQGSGTSSIEAVASSLLNRSKCLVYVNGTFGERMAQIFGRHFKEVKIVTNTDDILTELKTNKFKTFAYVQFETSKSIYNNLSKEIFDYCKQNNIVTVTDCVSSLGFYQLPNADIICSSSAKLLSGCPVMGIVMFNNINLFDNVGNCYYLDIMRYYKSGKNNQTPHTSLIPQMETLYNNILNRVKPRQIINNCKQFTTTKLQKQNEKEAPVITFIGTEEQVNKLFLWFNIFKIEPYFNKVYMKNYFQISTFSYSDPRIYKFINNIMEVVL